jgi:hypothetical protein
VVSSLAVGGGVSDADEADVVVLERARGNHRHHLVAE